MRPPRIGLEMIQAGIRTHDFVTIDDRCGGSVGFVFALTLA